MRAGEAPTLNHAKTLIRHGSASKGHPPSVRRPRSRQGPHTKNQPPYLRTPTSRHGSHTRHGACPTPMVPKRRSRWSTARHKWPYKQSFTRHTHPPDQWTSTKHGPRPWRAPHTSPAMPYKHRPPSISDPWQPSKIRPPNVRCTLLSKKKSFSRCTIRQLHRLQIKKAYQPKLGHCLQLLALTLNINGRQPNITYLGKPLYGL